MPAPGIVPDTKYTKYVLDEWILNALIHETRALKKNYSRRLNDKLGREGEVNLLRNVLNANYAPGSSDSVFH